MIMIFEGVNLSRTVEEFTVIAKEDSVQNSSDSVIARSDVRTTQDSSGLEHTEPLGVTKTTSPNGEKMMATAISVQGMVFGILAVCLAVAISLVVRYWRRAHNQAG